MLALLKFNCGADQGSGSVSGRTQGDLGLHHGNVDVFPVPLMCFLMYRGLL